MTGFVRRAILLGVAGLFVASVAMANVPDPSRSTCCGTTAPRSTFTKVVGFARNGTPDAEAPGVGNANVGAQCCVTVKDFNGNVIAGIRVEVDFSDCCDINLCSNTVNLVSCTPPIISGFTDAGGVFCYTATGGAKDNGVYIQPNATNGAHLNCVETRAGTVVLCRQTAISYDQDGARATGGTPGVDFTEISIVKSLVTANSIPFPVQGQYRGRADYNADTKIDFVDISFVKTQVTRASIVNDNGTINGRSSATGCPGLYCTAKVPGPNCP